MTTLAKGLAGVVVVLIAAVVVLIVTGQGRARDHAAEVDALNTQRIAALADAQAEAEAQAEKVAEKHKAVEEAMREASAEHDAEAGEFHMASAAMRHQVVELHQVVEEANREIAIREEEIAHLREANRELADAYQDSLERMATQDQVIQSFSEERSLEDAQQAERAAALEAALAEVQRQAASNRNLREQYRALEAELEAANIGRDAPGAMPIDDRAAPADDDTPPLTGEVTGVESMGDELTLVEIDLGSNDRVVEGMVFRVYRNEVYIATVRISAVDEAVAVGQITQRSGTVEVGDAVRSGE